MPYVLRFIAGQFEGGEFPLKPNREILIGRSSEYDMVLDEDRVSRCHAKIATFHGEIMLHDLGSTNGTFVNGKRTEQVRLMPGDRVLVGASVMELVSTDQIKADLERTPVNSTPVADKTPRATVSMSQLLKGCFPEDEKLETVCTHCIQTRRSGVLHVESDRGDWADLHLNMGRVERVQLQMADATVPAVGGKKCFFRVIGWPGGVYSFQSRAADPEGGALVVGESEVLLALALEERESLAGLAAHVPPRNATIKAVRPLETLLSELSAEALDTFQKVYNMGVVSQVVDASDSTDLETYTDLLYLLQNGYLTLE